MKADVAEHVPSILVSELFFNGQPRPDPVFIERSSAGVRVQVELRAGVWAAECTYRRWIGRERFDEVSYEIRVSVTRPHFGGERRWIHCGRPGCGRRCGRLFLGRPYLICRQCAGVRYRSQVDQTRNYGRHVERGEAIRAQLGGRPLLFAPFPPRPKGMHNRTYERLRQEVVAIEDAEKARMNKAVNRGELSLGSVVALFLSRMDLE